MHANEKLIENFYKAFQKTDYITMQNSYHEEATFSDAAFVNLSSREVKAMWQMLLTRSTGLVLTFTAISANDTKGSAHWEAIYTFSKTGRKVHNKIDATFEFKDGKIYRHTDVFNFHQWASQALGVMGMLLGWTSFLQQKVQKTARKQLQLFMAQKEL